MARLALRKPASPTKLPLAFSSMAQKPKPFTCQDPTLRRYLAQTSSSLIGFMPMRRVVRGSAHSSTSAGKSSLRYPRRMRRGVVSVGIFIGVPIRDLAEQNYSPPPTRGGVGGGGGGGATESVCSPRSIPRSLQYSVGE